MSADILPLFPLEVVLFPGMPLPLHIFEPRYKLMTRQCRERREPFGVLWAGSEGVAQVGCTAEIVKVIREYDDGRSDILTMGQSRFRVLQTFDDLPYLQGRVDLLEDEEATLDAGVADHLRDLYREVHQILYGRAASRVGEESGVPFSFRIAAELPLDLDTRQEVLELLSEPERQFVLAERLEGMLPSLQRREQARQKAGGNGYGR